MFAVRLVLDFDLLYVHPPRVLLDLLTFLSQLLARASARRSVLVGEDYIDVHKLDNNNTCGYFCYGYGQEQTQPVRTVDGYIPP